MNLPLPMMTSSGECTAEPISGWLVQVYPFDLEQKCTKFDGRSVTLGRSDECDIVLDDESVSRQHARIVCADDGYTILDSGSTNGVLINGQITKARLLRRGDIIQLGKRIFRFLSGRDLEAQHLETLYSMLTRDGLTSVHNHRFFHEYLEREVCRSKWHRRPLSLILLDVDQLESIVRKHGQLAGDEVLREVALRLKGHMREDDLLARIAESEFAIMCGEADLISAMALAEQCRHSVSGKACLTGGGPLNVTACLGVATLMAAEESACQSLLSIARENLDAAKYAGINNLVGPTQF
ncbi:MAG: GGDEF domain-containing protein [Planctomycetales bacterium]|nr:GGDEF domain-containing protein [Planctomycetales bacterium]